MLKIVLLDFAGEKNRGDAAMQMSLVMLAKKFFPDARIDIVSSFGCNQFPEALSQFDHTFSLAKANDITFYGGLLDTYDAFGSSKTNRHYDRVRRIFSLVRGGALLLLLKIHVPEWITSFFLSQKKASTLRVLREADYIIWNGRNFRGTSKLGELLHLLKLTYHARLCHQLGKSVACLGASVWPAKTKFSESLLVKSISACQIFTLRESASYALVCKLLENKRTHVKLEHVTDLSLFSLQNVNTQIHQQPASKTKCVAMTLVGEREVGDPVLWKEYVRQINKLATHIIDNLKYKILIIAQVTAAAESNETTVDKAFSSIGAEYFEVLNTDMTVAELTAAYAQVEFLFATRMHSAIFALSAGTPALVVAYDEGAKWSILSDMGLPKEDLFNMSQLPDINLVEKFDAAFKRREHTSEIVEEQLQSVLYPVVEEQFRTVYADLHG